MGKAHEKRYSWNEWTCAAAAARNGHLEYLKYAHAPPVGEGCSWDERTFAYAAYRGNLECLKYAHAPDGDLSSCPWDKKTCAEAAIKGGHLECLEYFNIN